MLRRARLLIASLAIAVPAVLPVVAAAEPFRLIVTDLTPPLVPNSVMDLAVELGYFEREGVDVELVRVQQTPSAMAALLAGDGDMANISVDAALQMVGRDQMQFKAVLSPGKALPFVIAAQDAIATPADLEGKAFAIGRVGSLDHSLSTAVLRSMDVDTDRLRFVAIGQPNVRAQALAAGQVDATTMSIGVWMSLPDTTGLHVMVDQDAYYAAAPVVQKVNVVPDQTLAQRRDDVVAVTRALTLAARDFAAKPELWVDAMAKARPDVAREDLEALSTAFADSWSVNGGLDRGQLDFTVDWLFKGPDFQDIRRPELSEWVDFSIVDDALKTLGPSAGSDQPGR